MVTEFEVVMPESGKWWPKWVRNSNQWSKWVQNLKWSCAKMVVKVCEKQEVVVKVGAEFEVATCENGKWWSK